VVRVSTGWRVGVVIAVMRFFSGRTSGVRPRPTLSLREREFVEAPASVGEARARRGSSSASCAQPGRADPRLRKR